MVMRTAGDNILCVPNCDIAFCAAFKEGWDWRRVGRLGWCARAQNESELDKLVSVIRARCVDADSWPEHIEEEIRAALPELWFFARDGSDLDHGDILYSARGETLILNERGDLPELLYQAGSPGALVPVSVTAAIADPVRFYRKVSKVSAVALCPMAHRGIIEATLREAGSPIRPGQIVKARLHFDDQRLLGPKWGLFAGRLQTRHLAPRLFVKTAADGWVDATARA